MVENKVLAAKLAYIADTAKAVNEAHAKGKSSVMILRPGERPQFEKLHTGSPALDARLGGGIPRGMMMEVFGPASAGKSTLAYSAIAELHRRDPDAIAALMDFEGSYDEARAERMGIDNARVVPIESTEGAEAAFEVLRKLLEEGPRTPEGRGIIDLVVIDSVSAIVPQAEFDAEIVDMSVGLLARLMSRMLRMLNLSAKKSKTTFIWINQTREKIGVMYGNPETTSGGKSLEFYSVVRIRTGKGQSIKEGDEEVAIIAKMTVYKNKLSGTKGIAEVKITPRSGVDFGHDVYTLGQKVGAVAKAGSFFTLTVPNVPEIKAQGKDSFIDQVNAVDGATRLTIYDYLLEQALSDPKATLDEEETDAPMPTLDSLAAGVEAEGDEANAAVTA